MVNLLIDYLEQRLAPAEHREIEAHFKACPECEEFLRAYRSTVTLIRNLREDRVRIPEPVQARLQKFLKKHGALTEKNR